MPKQTQRFPVYPIVSYKFHHHTVRAPTCPTVALQQNVYRVVLSRHSDDSAHGIVYLQYALILQVFECVIPLWTTLLYESISVWLRSHWGLNSARLRSKWTTARVCMCDLQASLPAEHVEDPCEPLRNMAGAWAEGSDVFDSQLQRHHSGSCWQFL